MTMQERVLNDAELEQAERDWHQWKKYSVFPALLSTIRYLKHHLKATSLIEENNRIMMDALEQISRPLYLSECSHCGTYDSPDKVDQQCLTCTEGVYRTSTKISHSHAEHAVNTAKTALHKVTKQEEKSV